MMDASARRLLAVAAVNVVGAVAEFVGGLVFGSVALMSDAVHMLFDALSYAMAFVTTWFATSHEGTDNWTYGFHRLEVLSAFVNGAALIPMALFIVYESYQRFLAPVQIDTAGVIALGAFGLLVNLASIRVVEGEGMGLNERGAYLHLLGDAGGSVAVILGAIGIRYLGLPVLDPVVAVLIALLVFVSAGSVITESLGIFLQRSPFPASDIQEVIESVDGVSDAHDVRVWEVCSQVCVATVHAVVTVDDLEAAKKVRQEISSRLREEFGIHHVTVQVEQEPSEQPTDHGMEDHDH